MPQTLDLEISETKAPTRAELRAQGVPLTEFKHDVDILHGQTVYVDFHKFVSHYDSETFGSNEDLQDAAAGYFDHAILDCRSPGSYKAERINNYLRQGITGYVTLDFSDALRTIQQEDIDLYDELSEYITDVYNIPCTCIFVRPAQAFQITDRSIRELMQPQS